MDYLMDLDSHPHRIRYKCKDYVTYQIYNAPYWCGLDLHERPYGICIKDAKKNKTFYSTIRYQFATKKDAMQFCARIIEEDLIEDIEQELLWHWKKLEKVLDKLCTEESADFQAGLKKHNMTVKELRQLHKAYMAFPTYIRRYLDKKMI
jgi:predicted HTH transcriptional regulator